MLFIVIAIKSLTHPTGCCDVSTSPKLTESVKFHFNYLPKIIMYVFLVTFNVMESLQDKIAPLTMNIITVINIYFCVSVCPSKRCMASVPRQSLIRVT